MPIENREAPLARMEINESNRNVAIYSLVTLVLPLGAFALHLVFGYPQLLALVPIAGLPDIGVRLTGFALVSRHWMLWTKANPEVEMQPDQLSRMHVGWGGFYIMLWNACIVILAMESMWTFPDASLLQKIIFYSGASLHLLAIVLLSSAGAHKPTFHSFRTNAAMDEVKTRHRT